MEGMEKGRNDNMAIDIHIEPEAGKALESAARALVAALQAHREHPVLCLFSGGSALKMLNFIRPEDISCHQLTISILDERVTTNPASSNFAQLAETEFFKRASALGAHYIDTRTTEQETPEELARKFEQALKSWRLASPEGVIIITQGIGPDGHTAGIMPYPEDDRAFSFLFDDSGVWVVGYDAGQKSEHPLRVTVTLPFLRLVDTSVIYVCGADKKEKLEKILEDQGDIHGLPGRILHEMKHCLLYTDQPVVTVK